MNRRDGSLSVVTNFVVCLNYIRWMSCCTCESGGCYCTLALQTFALSSFGNTSSFETLPSPSPANTSSFEIFPSSSFTHTFSVEAFSSSSFATTSSFETFLSTSFAITSTTFSTCWGLTHPKYSSFQSRSAKRLLIRGKFLIR